jgi:hypothetical protein
VNTGATELRHLVPADQLPVVLEVYNHALRQVFLISAGLSATAILGALGLEWKSVKKDKKGAVQKGVAKDAEKQ